MCLLEVSCLVRACRIARLSPTGTVTSGFHHCPNKLRHCSLAVRYNVAMVIPGGWIEGNFTVSGSELSLCQEGNEVG